LASIYIQRGLDAELAKQVAEQLMAHDALTAHARDELGISDISSARPVQAALASAGTFAIGAAMPLLTVLISPSSALIPVVVATSILFLALLGGFGAYAGGAPVVHRWCTGGEGGNPRDILGCPGDGTDGWCGGPIRCSRMML
jgi:VIT1/CCC1 family predicted Fe2+/Mn2+ transporter